MYWKKRAFKKSLICGENLRASEKLAKRLERGSGARAKPINEGTGLSRAFRLQWRKKQELKDHYRLRSWNSAPETWESRLDILLWRSRLVSSLEMGRQLINHGFVLVNGAKVRRGSALLTVGDLIELGSLPAKLEAQVREENGKMGLWLRQGPPAYLEVHYGSLRAIVADRPVAQDGGAALEG